MKIDIQKITNEVIEKTVKQAVENIISREAGYGLNNDIQQALKERARHIIETDEEINKMLRDALIYWINKQTL